MNYSFNFNEWTYEPDQTVHNFGIMAISILLGIVSGALCAMAWQVVLVIAGILITALVLSYSVKWTVEYFSNRAERNISNKS